MAQGELLAHITKTLMPYLYAPFIGFAIGLVLYSFWFAWAYALLSLVTQLLIMFTDPFDYVPDGVLPIGMPLVLSPSEIKAAWSDFPSSPEELAIGAVLLTAAAAIFAGAISTAAPPYKPSSLIDDGIKKIDDDLLKKADDELPKAADDIPPPTVSYRGDLNELLDIPEVKSISKHAEDRIMGDRGDGGVNNRAIRDAIINPLERKWQDTNQTWRYTGNDARVVLSTSGNIVTAIPLSSAGRRFPIE